MYFEYMKWVKKGCKYLGRNGEGNSVGVKVMRDGDCVTIAPINTKDIVASCYIEIPVEEVEGVIATMRRSI